MCEAEFRHGRPEGGYSHGPALRVRRRAGAAALDGGEARAVLAEHSGEWQTVLDRLEGRQTHRATDQLKVGHARALMHTHMHVHIPISIPIPIPIPIHIPVHVHVHVHIHIPTHTHHLHA